MLDRYYKNKRWLYLRESILRRDGYQCQYSKRYGRLIPANTVHHIFPLEDFPQYAYEPWNLISLSAEAHNMMHVRNTNELTDIGLDLLKRTARKNNLEIPLRYR